MLSMNIKKPQKIVGILKYNCKNVRILKRMETIQMIIPLVFCYKAMSYFAISFFQIFYYVIFTIKKEVIFSTFCHQKFQMGISLII